MRTFFTDYWTLVKHSGKFAKKHWKGLLVTNAIVFLAEMAYYECRYGVFGIKEKIKSKLSKEEEL